MVYTTETEMRKPHVDRESTSMNIDSKLWREVRKMAIDKGITATEYFEQALRDKLAKDVSTSSSSSSSRVVKK